MIEKVWWTFPRVRPGDAPCLNDLLTSHTLFHHLDGEGFHYHNQKRHRESFPALRDIQSRSRYLKNNVGKMGRAV